MRAAGDGGLLVPGVILAVSRPTVLVLRALGLGDLLTAVPALRGLRSAYSDHHLVLAAPAPLRELALLTAAVDDLLPTAPGRTPKATARLGPLSWRQAPPAVAVNLHGRGPQSIRALRALHPTVLLTHAAPGEPGLEWDSDLHEVRRWCQLLEYFGIPADPSDLQLARPPAPSPAPGAVIVHPGCAFAARHWPVDRYAAVARRLAGAGRRVVVTGSVEQRPLATQLAAAADLPDDAVLAGGTTLSQLAALVADAALLICGDTGIAHLATAYRTPSVVLFGPVSPQHWGPPPERLQHVALWAGSTGDTFADQTDPGLLRITTAEVIATAERLLSAAIR
ncbi:MAG: glycosyltransferase family 9 protein [Pseudonocardiales bacterium]|nr:glycosyltransferase family 9 protein [Pseudonocardiales bacterium]MBV9728933.1 glycosyltransferase family 9 protein [Pseudonocardiales bacterium]